MLIGGDLTNQGVKFFIIYFSVFLWLRWGPGALPCYCKEDEVKVACEEQGGAGADNCIELLG